jgi:MOB kinase activator 1
LNQLTRVAVDFFNQVNMLYSTVTEFCSPTACPTMSAGQRYEYLWADPTPSKAISSKTGAPIPREPLKMSAPEYVDTLMTYIQSRIDDEATFPSRIGAPFPKGFISVVKTIWRRLFRVYAHVYCEHFSVIVGLGLESHLNTSFKHFVLFAKEFEYFPEPCVCAPFLALASYLFWLRINGRLIENKDFAPLAELVESMLEQEE